MSTHQVAHEWAESDPITERSSRLVSEADMARQLALEAESYHDGIMRYERSVEQKRKRGLESETRYGKELMRATLGKVSEAITAKRGAGRPGIAFKYLALIEPEVAAFIALRTIIDHLSVGDEPLVRTAVVIGERIEDELRFRKFHKEEPHLYKLVWEDLKKFGAGSYQMMATALGKRMAAHEVAWEAWPEDHCLHLGMKLIDLIVANTAIVTIQGGEAIGPHRRIPLHLVVSEEVWQWMRENHEHWSTMAPWRLPTIVPPKPWDGVSGGGYWSTSVKPLNLVKRRLGPYLRSLAQTDLTNVLHAVNIAQETAWSINGKVLEVAQHAWDVSWTATGMPQREPTPIPPKPVSGDEAQLKAWRFAARKIHQENALIASKAIQAIQILRIAQKFKGESRIYFPYQLDFRGRMYAVPGYLHPQSSDLARGCLQFAEGKPIGDVANAYWLAIHGANLFGYDKCDLEARIMWVEDHERDILASAADPYVHDWWCQADGGDNAFQFLAFCFEWAGYKRNGAAHITRLPIALDGSCNGLQHFSAMFRDPVGGKATNLIPSLTPQDIYQEVANKTLDLMRADNDSTYVKGWLEWGINRKITKRSVMILPYGGTRHSSMEYVTDAVLEQAKTRKLPFTNAEVKKAIGYLAKMIWRAIGLVVVKAVEAMGWLRKVAAAYNSTNLPIVWKTPMGFTVFQEQRAVESRKVDTKLLGKTRQVWMNLTPDHQTPLDYQAQITGISPNYIHSMDASAMMACLILSQSRGVTNFAMIHDSYGTLAPDTQVLADSLRETFVDMYHDFDPADSFPAVPIPPAPACGGLDLESVLSSPFFFA